MPRPSAWDTSFEEIFNGGVNRVTDSIQIPDYQRRYEWPRSLVEQLFDDFSEYRQETPVADIADSPYYLGNLVIHEEGDDWDIVDGQQRITALTLMATALRDVVLDKELFALGMNVQRILLSRDTWSGHFLSAKCEDPAGAWPDIESHEDRASVRFYQNLYKNHVEYNVEFNGIAAIVGPQVGVRNYIDIEPATARFSIIPGGPGAATHPEIQFENGITFQMENKDPDPAYPQHGGNLTIAAGDEIVRVFGTLNIPAGETLNTGDTGTVNSINNQQDWWVATGYGPSTNPSGNYRVPKAYCKLKEKFEHDIAGLLGGALEGRLNHWFTVLRHTAFTITMFDELEAAIFHFEKMNDKSYSLGLDAGDLMRREKVVCSMKAREDTDTANGFVLPAGVPVPADLTDAAEDITDAWAVIQYELATGEHNVIGAFLRAMHISTGNNVTASKTFREHKTRLRANAQYARAAIPAAAPTAALDALNAVETLKMQAYHVSLRNWFQNCCTLAPFFREIAAPDVTAVAELHRIELKNLSRAGYKQQLSLFLRGKYVIDTNRAAFTASPAFAALTLAAQSAEEAAWDALFPRLIRIYEYLVIRGRIFPADLPGGGVASNVIWAKIAEWCGNLVALVTPGAARADIEGVLDDISADVVDMCGEFKWLSPTYTALVAANDATVLVGGVAGSTQADVAVAVAAVQTDDPSAEVEIADLAAAAGAEPNLADAIALVAATVPARSIDLSYMTLQINTPEACLLLSKIELARRGSTWATVAAAGGMLFQTKKDVEHIFPQKAQTAIGEPWDAWNAVPADEIKNYKNRLGNMTLLDDTANRALGRKSFADKQTEAVNGYNVKAQLGGGGWHLLNELRTATPQVGWLQADIDTRTENLLNELFDIYDPNP